MAKSHVAPLKPVTIPRLELTAALVSVKISAILQRELEYEEITETFWTDSKVIIGYISHDARRFHVLLQTEFSRSEIILHPVSGSM